MNITQNMISQFGKPIANVSFAMMYRQVRAIEKSGVAMMHTARPFSYYRKVFYHGQSEATVLAQLKGKCVVDVGCGYTPFADDSMFQACHLAGIEFYGVDPLIGSHIQFSYKERLLAKAMGSQGNFTVNPPGADKALSACAQELPFEDQSVDELLCSYLLFVWIEDEAMLATIFSEFLRVIKPNGKLKLYPLSEWVIDKFKNPELRQLFAQFNIEQHFVHGGLDFRVTPAMMTVFSKV